MSASARQTAYSALMRVEQAQSYSNITLDSELEKSSLSRRDRSFAAKLFYGVLENKLLLDYNIAVRSRLSVRETDTGVLVLLRLGLYQLFFADSVPASAAVNETVAMCRENGFGSAAGFVNGILRATAREGRLRLPDPKKGRTKYLSIKYSCPEKITALWRKSYGDELTAGLLGSLAERPPLCIRVNTLRTTAEELKTSLEESGVSAEIQGTVKDCLLLSNTGAIEKLPQFEKGLFHVQDSASQLCCALLAPQEGDILLDMCSAPGGKSFTCAELMNGRGSITALDLYSSRLGLVSGGAERLGIDIIKTIACDAAGFDTDIKADRVLCDVPCSGLGIIRRKPELRYKTELGTEELPELQYRILCNASRFVKSGGRLLYSTCTLNPAENSGNAKRFLGEHEDFVPVPLSLPERIKRGISGEDESMITLFPHINGTDGFFISLFQRK